MSTSLAEQLKRLRVPQTEILKQRDKKRASLLFDPSEAATHSKDVVYQIGLDGLEELIAKNPVFQQFENNLFESTSKDVQRAVEDSEVNKNLDSLVKKFLLNLSPHFLSHCSYKALEWLIYRFQIQKYNKEDLLMLILPYHETNIFVRVLQMIYVKQPGDKWYWLRPLQKRGAHLVKQNLFNHAASDSYFLQTLSNYFLTVVNEHEKPQNLTHIFNFYWQTFTGALEYCEEVGEAQVTQMLPVILKGLVSDIPDFAAASYVVTAQLVAKTHLSDKLLDKFVLKLASCKVSGLISESILALIILYQSQKQYKRMSLEAVNKLCSHWGVARAIQKHNEAGINVYDFLEALLHSAIKIRLDGGETNKELDTFLDEFLDTIKFDDYFVPKFIRLVLDLYVPRKGPVNKNTWLKDLFLKIEKQYPDAYDKEIHNIMKITSNQPDYRLKSHLHGILHRVLDVGNTWDVFHKLYNPNATIRASGIQILRKRFDFLLSKDRKSLQSVVLDRLEDESPHVVRNTLQLLKAKFKELFDQNELTEVLIRILRKCFKDETFTELTNVALEIACDYFSPSDVKGFLALFPFLLPLTERELKTSQIIANSDYGENCPILKRLKEKLQNSRTYTGFTGLIYKGLKEHSDTLNINALVAILTDYKEEVVLYNFLLTILLSNALPKDSSPELSASILQFIRRFVDSCSDVLTEEYDIQTSLKLARDNILPLQEIFSNLKAVIAKTEIGNANLGNADFTVESSSQKFYLLLLDMLIKGCCVTNRDTCMIYANTLKVFLERFCKNLPTTLGFLLNVTVADSESINDKLRVYCLKTISNLLKSEPPTVNHIISLDNVLVPYLLVNLNRKHSDVRKMVINIMEYIMENLDKNKRQSRIDYSILLEKLIKYKENLQIDHEQISFVIDTIINEETNKEEFKQCLDSICSIALSANMPLYLASGIANIFARVKYMHAYEIMAKLAVEILNNEEKCTVAQSKFLYCNLIKVDSYIGENLSKNSPVFQFVSTAIKNDTTILNIGDSKLYSPSEVILNQMDREVFASFGEELKELLLDDMIFIASTTKNPEVSQSAFHVFKKIDLDVKLVVKQLQAMQEVQSRKKVQTKQRRVSIIPTVDILNTIEWKKGVTVLEFLQDKKKIRNTSSLLSILFGILKKCLDFDEQASVEYPKQLVLSDILHCCDKNTEDELPQSAFDMQLVVQCIRASPNPQTHHHALLLLTYTAKILPKEVLNHIIAVFTFMGSSVLRHDDAYSFQIISKIIETVIPILVQDKSTESIATVLRVFTDAILDIPEHRRMPFLKQLLVHLNPEENLYLFLLLIFEAHVVRGYLEKQKIDNNPLLSKIEGVARRLQIAANLCKEFSPNVGIKTCIKLFEYLRKLPEEKEDKISTVEDSYTFDIDRYTAKQFRHYKYTLVTFVAGFLADPDFVAKIASMSDEEMLQMEQLYKDAIINILSYIQETSKVADKNSQTSQTQYWKVMLHHTYDVLDSLNALLTPQMFLLVIRGLMVHSLNNVRRRALELLNTKLQYQFDIFKTCQENDLYALIPPLLNIVKKIEEDEELESDEEVIIQTSLLSLKLLTKRLAPSNHEKFTKILDFISTLIKSGKPQDNVLASLILCLAELCNSLRAHAISDLSKFMPVLIKILKNQKRTETPSLLLLSDLTAITKILNSLPLFLSPYLQKLLIEVCTISAKWKNESNSSEFTTFISKINEIEQKIGNVIPLRVLLPATEESYQYLIEKKHFGAVGPLMTILSDSIKLLKGTEIQGYLNELTEFFMNALQFRTESDANYEEVNEVESHVIAAFVTLILKLSESSFRPVYYKLFDWAVRADVKTERVITFYNLSSLIAERLKGLFVLFAGHFLNNAANLLNSCNSLKDDFYFEDEGKNLLLIEYMLKTLHYVFMYDTHKFINKERFEVLMQPLIDQLENTVGGLEKLQNRSSSILTPCIVQFAVAISDDVLWKQMNYQILLKTRHNCTSIKLGALECLKETAKKLGEDFLPLLPETIPFLAELLEDEDETVEKACQKSIQELEKVLGEPLQKYF